MNVALITPALAAGALLLCSCEPQRAWKRIDLWVNPPFVAGTPTERAPQETVQRGEHERYHKRLARHAPLIRGLRQETGSRWVERVRLGRNSYLEFRSVLADGKACKCTHRISARSSSRPLTLLAEVPAGQATPFGPDAEQIGLEPFEDEEIELILEVESAGDADDGEAAVIWGSPAIRTRLPATSFDRPGSLSAQKPNVILIGADTLRARSLGAWGHDPTLTPALDRLAGQSDVWLNTYSTFNATNPSFASLFTGLYGKDHRIYTQSSRLPKEHTTLAESFQKSGYATFAAFSVRHLAESGLDQGFDYVQRPDGVPFSGRLAVDEAMNWLDRLGPQPFFAFIHLWDPHTPHTPPGPYDRGLRHSRAYGLGPVEEWTAFREIGPRAHTTTYGGGGQADLYDGEVAYTDRQVDRLMGYLEEQRLLENTIVVFVADHGENLDEHQLQFRHAGLYETTTHVPLIIRWPGETQTGRVFKGLAQTLDIFPTLLEAAGLEAPPHSGVSLRELAEREPGGRRLVFSEHANQYGESVVSHEYRYSVLRGGPNIDGEIRQLFQLSKDPGEEINLAAREPELAARLAEVLANWTTQHGTGNRPAPAENLDAETIQQLEALGYLTR